MCDCDLTADVWNHIHDVLLPKYSQRLNGVNVMSGPVFDEDFDGNVDALRATSRSVGSTHSDTAVPTNLLNYQLVTQ